MSRPRPVLTSAGITGAIQGVVLILSFLGYQSGADSLSAETQTIVAVCLGIITLGGNVLHALHAQEKVTPVASPVAASGVPLVPVTVVANTPPPPPDLTAGLGDAAGNLPPAI